MTDRGHEHAREEIGDGPVVFGDIHANVPALGTALTAMDA